MRVSRRIISLDLGECLAHIGETACVQHHIPRKEVIQPHLPVRLPCYDFTPITDPTLDACFSHAHQEGELAQRLQVSPTFVV